jgi:N-acetyl-gamma-glutamyl-phosphate/LysW-gamma-L-alpha-aminoadipyl-6-phosphate reductase
MAKLKAAIVGGSGYTGGELLRILLRHPKVEVASVTSRNLRGRYVYKSHPNLRGATKLRFTSPDDLSESEYDVIFLALPHGASMERMEDFIEIADKVIDLSADFRLKDKEDYVKWYGYEHKNPKLLQRFVYGMPELYRERIKRADLVAVPGCIATSAIIPLKPLVDEFRVKLVVVDSKVGSSAGGAKINPGSHHPERSGVVRSYKPTGHRHLAEMEQELNREGTISLNFSPHAIEMVRGIMSTIHLFMEDSYEYEERDIWQAYVKPYKDEPFVRLVRERGGLYRYPEPKLLIGTNYCDVGFEKDVRTGRLVVMSALDNLVKGAAGQAVQCMNLMFGLDERAGLESMGFHPI